MRTRRFVGMALATAALAGATGLSTAGAAQATPEPLPAVSTITTQMCLAVKGRVVWSPVLRSKVCVVGNVPIAVVID